MKTGKAAKAKPAGDHELNQESSSSKAGPYPPSQPTTRSVQGRSTGPDQANMNHSKRDPSLKQRWKAPSL